MYRWVLATSFAVLVSLAAQAQTPALFAEADLGLGRQLIAEHNCSACHVRKVGGDGSAIYRPQGRINSPSALRTMVEMCNTELNLAMFPDEVTSVAAVLEKDHYRFAASVPAR
jgi:hypothetical protein